MSLFFGLPLSDQARARLGSLAEDVGKARWVAPDAMHVTLRFLGKIDDALADRMRAAVRARAWPKMTIGIRGVGTFGPPRRARVLWAGVDAGPEVSAAAADLEGIARELGLAPEPRAFSPHVTLARLKDPRPAALQSFLRKHESLAIAPFEAAALVLWRSRTLADGARYDEVERFG